MEIAAYVFAADEMASRGGPTMAAMGRDWRRRFRFVVPRVLPCAQSRPEVVEALTDALNFVSEDEFRFESPFPVARRATFNCAVLRPGAGARS